MKYRFLLTNRKAETGSFECDLKSDPAAKRMAADIVHGVSFIQRITIYRLLTDDSCGPITCIGMCDREDL